MHFRSEDFPVEESPSAIWAVGAFVKNIFKGHLNFAHLQIANVTSAGPRGELQCGGGCRGWELVELDKWGCGNRQSQGSDPLQLARKRWPYEMLGSSHQDEFFYSHNFTKSHYLEWKALFSPQSSPWRCSLMASPILWIRKKAATTMHTLSMVSRECFSLFIICQWLVILVHHKFHHGSLVKFVSILCQWFFCSINRNILSLAAWSKLYGTEYDVLLVDWHDLAIGKYICSHKFPLKLLLPKKLLLCNNPPWPLAVNIWDVREVLHFCKSLQENPHLSGK